MKLSFFRLSNTSFIDHNITLHLISDANAVCIDGSRSAFLFRRGYGTNESKWIIFFEGGGWCYSLDDCLVKSITMYGSKSLQLNDNRFHRPSNYFSATSENLLSHNWSMVYVAYCDGGSFTGDSVRKYKNHTLYFKGQTIFSSLLFDLGNLGIDRATHIIVSGSSAGGLSALIHVDKFKQKFQNSFVVGLIDAGFFFPTDIAPCKYNHSMHKAYEFMNSANGVHPDCRAAKLGGRCLIGFDTYQFVKSPLFIIQSKFDHWQIENVFCVSHPNLTKTNLTKVDKFGQDFENRFIELFKTSIVNYNKNNYNMALLKACPYHGNNNKYYRKFDHWNQILFDNQSEQMLFLSWYSSLNTNRIIYKDILYYHKNMTEFNDAWKSCHLPRVNSAAVSA